MTIDPLLGGERMAGGMPPPKRKNAKKPVKTTKKTVKTAKKPCDCKKNKK